MPLKKPSVIDYYALGIEGGATQATWCLMNQHRRVFAKGTISKCLNVRLIDEEHILSILKEIKEKLPHCPNGVGFCVAGMMPTESKAKYQHLIRSIWPKVKDFFIGTDFDSSYTAALGPQDGILAIVGTGAVIFGRKGKEQLKVNGRGHIIGDWGGGYDIAITALQTIFREWDYKGTQPTLMKRLMKKAKVSNPNDLTKKIIQSQDKRSVAQFAETILAAAEDGDVIAEQIIMTKAKEIAKGILTVARRLRLNQPKITFKGGIIDNSELYQIVIKRRIYQVFKRASFVHSPITGAMGAALVVLPTKKAKKK